MKASFNFVSGNHFRNIFACIALSAVCFFADPAMAQSITVPENAPVIQGASGDLQAAIYPVANTVTMKVHFANPEKRSISVVILNAAREVVYEKKLGKPTTFVGKFSLDRIPDGDYTLVVKSHNQNITRDFAMQTQVARIAQIR